MLEYKIFYRKQFIGIAGLKLSLSFLIDFYDLSEVFTKKEEKKD